MTTTRRRSALAVRASLLGGLLLALAACGGSSGMGDCGCDIQPATTEPSITDPTVTVPSAVG